ncbi:MAG: hypothetical protein O7A03_08115 [Alphaproteobacteria bacterium]|nr:hypothetical protein [Alphaproteobacteria bacterium]
MRRATVQTAARTGGVAAMIGRLAQLLHRYRQINWALADQALVSGVNFLTAILLARYLGLAALGQFTLAWTVVALGVAVQHAMIVAPMMSLGPKLAQAQAAAYYGAVLVHQLIFSAATFLAVLGGTAAMAEIFPQWGIDDLVVPLAAAVAGYQVQDFLRRYFFTCNRPIAAFANDCVRYIGQLAVLAWLFVLPPAFIGRGAIDVGATLLVVASTGFAAAALGAVMLGGISIRAAAWRDAARRHWKFGKWLLGSAALQWVAGNLLIVATGAMLSSASVGALRAAQIVLGPALVLFQGLENVVPARAAWHVTQGGASALTTYLKKISLVFGLITTAIAIAAAAVPEFWLKLAFGTQYEGYGYLVRWFAAMYIVWFFVSTLRAGLRAVEHTSAVFRGDLWTALFAVVFAYPLIRYFGAVGVAIGLLLGQLILIATYLASFSSRLQAADRGVPSS